MHKYIEHFSQTPHKKIYLLLTPHGTFSKTHYILGYHESLSRYKENRITLFFLLSGHFEFKLCIKKITDNGKLTNLWKLNDSKMNEKMDHDRKKEEAK